MDYYKVNQYRVCLKYGQYEQMVTQSPWIRTVNPLWLQLFLATNIQVRVSTAEMVRHRNELFLGVQALLCSCEVIHSIREWFTSADTCVCEREKEQIIRYAFMLQWIKMFLQLWTDIRMTWYSETLPTEVVCCVHLTYEHLFLWCILLNDIMYFGKSLTI